MLIVVACICVAGIILSLVARYPALFVLMAVLVGATVLAHVQGWTSLPLVESLPLTLVLEVVAIQVGYAIGVVGRGALAARRTAREGGAAPSPEINVSRPNGA